MPRFCLLLCLFTLVFAVEEQLLEDVLLAEDRAALLDRFVTGSEEWYYYSCLLAQQRGELEAVDALIATWSGNKRSSSYRRVMERRQALLWMQRDTVVGTERLRRLLQREGVSIGGARAKPAAGSRLRPEDVALAGQLGARGKRHERLDPWSARLLLDLEPMGPEIPWLLQNLQQTEHPAVLPLVLDALSQSPTFGNQPIHAHLLSDQLDALRAAQPELGRQQAWLEARIDRFRPEGDDWLHRPEELTTYLDQLEQLVSDPAPSLDSLRGLVAFYRLGLARAQGETGVTLIQHLLRLTWKHQPFIERKRWSTADWFQGLYEWSRVTGLPMPKRAGWVVTDALRDALMAEVALEAFAQLCEPNWLARLHAEAMVLAGRADLTAVVDTLGGPERMPHLRSSRELAFGPGNRTLQVPGEPIALQVRSKGSERLLIRIHRIDTLQASLSGKDPRTQAVDRNGLQAAVEREVGLDADPWRLQQTTIELPECTERGVYQVAIVADSQEIQATLVVGGFQLVPERSTNGQRFHLLDEQGHTQQDWALWEGGLRYGADDDGVTALPFADSATRSTVVVETAGYGQRFSMERVVAEPDLRLAALLNWDALRPGEEVEVLLRPQFRLAGRAVDPAALTDVTVTLSTAD